MKNAMKKLTAILTAILLVFQTAPVSILAEGPEDYAGQPLRNTTRDGEDGPFSCSVDVSLTQDAFTAIHSAETGSGQPAYYLIAMNGSEPFGYAGINSLSSTENSGVGFAGGADDLSAASPEILSTTSFVIAEYSGEEQAGAFRSASDILNGAEKTIGRNETFNGICFRWDNEPVKNPDGSGVFRFSICLESETAGEASGRKGAPSTRDGEKNGSDDVFVTIRNTGEEGLSLSSGYYYLVAGWNNGTDSYVSEALPYSLTGEYSFNTESLPSSHNQLFVMLKRYDTQPGDPREQSGTAVVAYPVIYNVLPDKNTMELDGGVYSFEIAGPREENGKKYFTIDVKKIPRVKASVSLAGGVSTDDLYVVFRQPIQYSEDKAFCAIRVTGNGTYEARPFFTNPNYGEQAFDPNAQTEVCLVRANEPGADLTSREKSWMFQNYNFSSNNGLTVYRNGSSYMGNADHTVTIIPETLNAENNISRIAIGAASYTARLDLYDSWGVKHTDPVSFDPVSVSAANGQEEFTGYITGNGTIESLTNLPSDLTDWTFGSTDFGGYILTDAAPSKEGNVYVFEARKPDTYTVRLRYTEAWSEEETASPSFGEPGTVTATGEDGQSYTGIIGTDGSLTMDPVPAITGWSVNDDNRIGDFTFKPSSAAGQENPSVDNETHAYILTLRKNRTYRAEIEYQDSWGRGKISEAVPVGEGYSIEARDKDDAIYTGTIDPETGAVSFGQELPEIASWTVLHDGAAEEEQKIGEFSVRFGESNPAEESRYDAAIDGAAGYYVITAVKPDTYSAELLFCRGDSDEPLDNVLLPENYLIRAVSEDNTVFTGTVSATGELTWEDGITELPKITEFGFFKADGTEEASRFGSYRMEVLSYDDDDLRAAGGVYRLIGREPKLYPSMLKYAPAPAADWSAHYYLTASIDGEKAAYAELPHSNTERLTFIPFGNAAGKLNFRLAAADADGAASAPGVKLPEDAEFTLIKSDGELNTAEIFSADAAPAVIEDYVLELKPEIEATSAGAGEQEEDTLVFRAQKMWTGNKIRISTYDYDGKKLKAPDTPFGNNYYLRVRILDQETNADVGWNLIPISDWNQSSQGDTTEITVDRFATLAKNPLNDNGESIWTAFDPEKHYIEVDTEAYPARVIRMTDTDWLSWDKATNPYYADDEPPEGYQYIKGTQEADAYRIKLKKAKETEYTVTLKFDTTDASRINLDGGLYVRVTIGHQSGENTYGWVPLSNAGYKKSPNMYTKDGCTYIDVPITEWKDAAGNTISGEKFRGTEESVRVELVGAAAAYGQQPTPGNSAPMKIGSYVNKAEVTAYPTGTENVDRFTDDSGESVTKIRDVVTLTLEPDSFDGYSLEYVLNGYNIVTLCPNTVASPSNSGAGAFGDGDFLMRNHCMGGVLIRGDIIHITGTGVADSEYITVPSVIGGYVPASAGPFINNRENNNNDWNAYIGSVNTVAGETVNGVTAKGSPSKPRPDGTIRGYTGSAGHTAAYGDTFVDWDRLQTAIVNASDNLAGKGRELSVSFPQADYQQEVTINVTLGDNVTVNYPENVILTVNIIAPEGMDLRDSGNIPATIVNNTGTGTYTAPKVTVNGEKLNTEEDGSGMSLVWNFPNAERVNLSTQVTPFFGHIVAPRSYIDVEGGNYSGCMVGNKVSSAGEGHLYPYTGGKLVRTEIGFEASKTIDELPPDPGQLFYFDLEELDQESGEWKRTERVNNTAGSIGFDPIHYSDAGTYYYRISEYPGSVSSDIRQDKTLYIVKSVVEPVLNGTEVKLVSTETYYRVPDGVTNYTDYYQDGENIRQRINESVLENLEVPEGMTGAEIAAQYLTFNNTSKNNSSITARKTLTGAELEENQFEFTIEKTGEPEEWTGSVNEENLHSPAKNNGNGLVNFGKLTFTLQEGQNSGTWVYTVKETQPDPVPPYYVYDRSEYEITFRVTRADGALNVERTIRQTKDASGAAVDIPADSITFANTRETGSLTISKTVVSPIPAEETQVFHFMVALELGGQPVTGKFGDYTFGSDGRAVIEAAGGSSVTIPGLPAGTEYRVTEAEETEDSVFTTEKTADSGTIVKEGKTAAFTNTRKTGSVSVSKTVVSPFPADAEKEFSFDIVLSEESITGDFAGTCTPADGEESGETTVRFSRGKATVKVRGGKTLTIEGLPAGTAYTVTEAENRDFVTEKDGDSGEITQDGVTAAFTNTRKTGDLEISKTVSGTSNKSKVFYFRIALEKDGAPFSGTYTVDAADTVKTANGIAGGEIIFAEDGRAVVCLKADEKITVKGLPKGISYTVEELNEEGHLMPAGYQQTAPAGNAQGTIVDEVNKAEFENTYSLQTTSVSFGGVKHIEGTGSTDKVFIFELYETGADYSIEGKTPTEMATGGSIGSAGQDYSFEKITYDTKDKDYYYVVREKAFNADDYKPEGWTADETVYRIHVRVEDGGDGKLKTATEIFDGEGNALTGADPGSLDFTNRYEAKGNVSFRAKKTFTGGTISRDKPFTIRLTQVTTDDIGTAEPVAGTEPVTATVSNGDEPTVSFNDAREFVRKSVNGQERNDCGVYYFLLEEVIPEGADENNIHNGIRYDGRKKIIAVTVSDNGDGTLNAVKEPAADSDGLDVTFTNEQLGSVAVTKTFELNGAALPPDFAITASYTDGTGTAHTETFTTANAKKNDQQETITDPYSWEIRNLPIGTEVTFTESGYSVNGYSIATTFTSPAEGGGTNVSESTTGKLKAAETPPTGAFVNTYTRETGSLKLKKTVTVNNEETTGKLADGTYSFRIHGTDALTSELEDRIISVTITNGKTDKVTEGETSVDIGEDGFAVISGLPTGTYTVTEEPPAEGITIAEKPENAIEIKKDEAGAEIKTAVFRNNKDAGDLLISKTVTGTTDNTKDFIFDITLTMPAGISLAESYPAETADSVRNNPKNSGIFDAGGGVALNDVSGESTQKSATVALKAGESIRIKDLPAGTGYAVSERTDSESMPAGYQKTSGDAAGSISATLSTAAFVNSYTAEKTSAAFGGIKRIQGTDRTEKEFYFELYQADEQYRTAGDPIQTVRTAGTIQASAGKSYGFTAITYDAAGDYYYTIKEKAFDPDTYPAEGWRLSEDEYHLHVHVYDSGSGSLAREIHVYKGDHEVTGSAPENSLEFVNTYQASGETDLKAQKIFTNGKLSEKRFSFRVTQVDSAAEDAQAVTGDGLKLSANPLTGITTSAGNTTDRETVTLANRISFTEADVGKTFRFRVEEDTDGLTLTDNVADGVRYDAQRSKLITVTVSDKGDGTLIITKTPERASGTDYDVTFTNEQLGKIRLKKTVKDSSGQPVSTDNRYTFTIRGNGEDRTVEIDANSAEAAVIDNLPLGTYTVTETDCPELSGYNHTGTTLKADNGTPSEGPSMEVTVTNSGEKTVSVEATNTYERKTGEAEIRVTKDYNNWGDGKTFAFTLTAGDNDADGDIDTPMPEGSAGTAPKTKTVTVNSEAGREATFGSITYDRAGTYHYTIQETGTQDGNGVTYDTQAYAVRVDVMEDSGENLTAVVTYGTEDSESLEIRNTYYAEGSAELSGTKTLEGRPFRDGETFSFRIWPVDGAPLRTAEGGAKQEYADVSTGTPEGSKAPIRYGTLYFSDEDLAGAEYGAGGSRTKVFEYTVSEIEPENKKGIVYAGPKTLKIRVTDNGNGELTAVPDEESEEPDFTNTYHASGETSLKAQKVFINGKLSEKSFSFRVTQVDSDGENAQAVTGSDLKLSANPLTVTTSAENTTDRETVTLADKISFTEADAGKTFRFRVEEVTDGLTLTDNIADGVRYDAQRSRLITVTVTDLQDGSPLVITKSPEPASGADFDLVFTNEQLGEIRLNKLVKESGEAGSTINTDNKYTFTISGNGVTREAEVTANGDAVTVGDLPLGTYTVTETGNPDISGYSYKETKLLADGTTTVSDRSAEVTIGSSGAKTVSVTATNFYETKSGETEIRVTKDYNNWGDGKAFTFILTAGDNDAGTETPMPEGSTTADDRQTVSVTLESSGTSHTAEFGKINYSKAGTYNYTIRETAAGDTGGLTIDSTEYSVAVTVTEKEGSHELEATARYATKEHPAAADQNSLTIRNAYSASGSAGFAGTKTLEGRTFMEGDLFTFTVTPADGAPLRRNADETMTMDTVTAETAAGESSAEIDYGTFHFTFDDLRNVTPVNGVRTKTFEYTVAEKIPEGDRKGITYADPQTLRITVTDRGTGTLEVALAEDSGAEEFVNTYDASGHAEFTGTKKLEGRPLTSEDSFRFTITPVDGAPLRRSADEALATDTVTADPASGTSETAVSFGEFYFTLSDLEGAAEVNGARTKTFEYTVEEDAPESDRKGITYAEPQTLRITVTDNGTGTLTVAPADQEAVPEFTNTYEASGSVVFRAKKTFTNGKFSGHPFTIRLTQVKGDGSTEQAEENVVLDPCAEKTLASNVSASTVTFDPIRFVKNGTVNQAENSDGRTKEYWFLIEELVPDGLTDTDRIADSIRYDSVTQKWIRVTLTDDGNGKLTAAKDPDSGTAPDAAFTNEQLGSVRVSKAFAGEAVNVEDSFAITAEYTAYGEPVTKTLKISGAEGAVLPAKGEGTKEKPYVWEIRDLPINTDVTFTESGFSVDGYSTETTFNDTAAADPNAPAGTARVGTETQTGAFVNTYTRDTGKLKIRKTVTVNGSEKIDDTSLVDGTYSFTIRSADGSLERTVLITISGGKMTGAAEDGNSLVIRDGYAEVDGLPTGDYTVTENESGLAERNLSLLRQPEGTLTVVKDEEGAAVPTADFENGRDVGSLEISKKVNGTSDRSKSFTFEVRLSMNSAPLSGSFPADASAAVLQASGIEDGKITFDAGGEATVVLKADEKIVIRNLPAGAGYTVRETDIPDGYSKTKPGGDAADAITTGVSKAEFENMYNLLSTNVTFGGRKTILGTSSTETVFTFRLYETDESYSTEGAEPVEVRTSGVIGTGGQNYSFSPITYSREDQDRTYYYVITEEPLDPEDTGWQTDTTVYKRKVEISDGGNGTLKTTVTDENGTVCDPAELNFANTYSANGSVSFSAKKIFLNGDLSEEGKSFTIRLSQVEDENSTKPAAPDKTVLSEPMERTVHTTDSADEQVVSFTPDDLFFKGIRDGEAFSQEGEYWFLLEEAVPDGTENGIKEGVRYEAAARKWIKVTVTDKGDGTLTAVKHPAPEQDGGTDLDAVFTNEQLGSVKVSKIFEGHDVTEGFRITAKYTADGKENTKVLTTGSDSSIPAETATENGKTKYTWTIADLPAGTKVSFTESGITADGYTVATTFNGTAVPDQDAPEGEAEAQKEAPTGAFINTYTRNRGSLKIVKTATVNDDPKAAADTKLVDGSYAFTVIGSGTAAGTSARVSIGITDGKAVSAEFDGNPEDPEITISLNDAGEAVIGMLPTGEYTVAEELTPEQKAKGIRLAESSETTLTVVKDGTGSIPAASFRNNREAGELKISKTAARTTSRDKAFRFTVALKDQNGDAVSGTFNAFRAGNDGNSEETIDFADGTAEITLYADESVVIHQLPGGASYTVTEDSASIPDGYSQTKPAGGGDAVGTIGRELREAAFENTYNLRGTSLTFGGRKMIDVAESTTQKFRFELFEVSGESAEPGENQKPLATAETDGTITTEGKDYSFGKITYEVDTKDSDVSGYTATHYYVVRESALDENGCWTAAKNIYRKTVVLTDDDSGNLKITINGDELTRDSSSPNRDLNFTNRYKASGTVSFSARKVFTGGDLGRHPFTIRLSEVAGEDETEPLSEDAVWEKTVSGPGNAQTVVFNEIKEFHKRRTDEETLQDDTGDEHWFLLEEIVPKDAEDGIKDDVRYDSAFRKWIKVTLKDDGEGNLEAVKELGEDKDGLDAVFTNEQLGGVKVSKAFIGHEEPEEFTITAKYSINGTPYTRILTTGGDSEIKPKGSGTADDPYIWEIGDLPLNTLVTFTENNITADDYAVTPSFNGSAGRQSGAVTADVSAPTGKFINRYTRDEGSLKIRKTVTVNSEPTGNETADGTYRFTVTGAEGLLPETTKQIDITIRRGKAVSAAIDGETVIPDTDGYVQVSGLPTGNYTVSEDEDNMPEGMRLVQKPAEPIRVVKDGTGTIPTAEFTNDIIEVCVKKVDAAGGKELKGARIQILEGETVVDDWISDDSAEGHTVTGLKPGTVYTLHEETAPKGYLITSDTTFTIDDAGKVSIITAAARDENGKTVLLVEDELIPAVSLSILKIWDDDSNSDGKRPASLSVKLLADGKKLKDVSLTAKNGWAYTEKNLPKFDQNNREIEYSWEEKIPAGYTQEGRRTNGDLTTLINKHTPAPVSVSVRKVWDDNGNSLGKRPASVKVQLFADGKAEGGAVMLNEANGWSHTWKNLKKCAGTSGGKAIVYTVEEIEVPAGYTMTRTGNAAAGFVITNSMRPGSLEIRKKFSFIPEKQKPLNALTNIPVNKIWDDFNNRDGNRPESITVRLYAGGKEVRRALLTEAGGWRYIFSNLPKYKGQQEIVYSISEDPVALYRTEIHGYSIINRYMPPLTCATVHKIWKDNDDAMRIRPVSIRMTLSNGTRVVLNAANHWTATVSDLPAVVNGEPAVYTWKEQEINGYRLTGTSVNGTLTTFTNTVAGMVTVPSDQPQPKVPGTVWYVFPEYDTALGGVLLINHVGDCFD